MDANANWRPTQGSDPAAAAAAAAGVDPNAPAGGDWRTQLQPEARSRIVNKIMETLKKHLPVSVPEGLNELQKIAVRFEEKIYTAATNQSDYLRKISLKMLSMETKTQQGPGNAQVIPNQNNPGQGRMKSEGEEWENNSKSWDSPSDILLNCVEHNSEMIRNLMYKIDELQELVEKLVKNSSPPSPKE